jgi:hypothetical protein
MVIRHEDEVISLDRADPSAVRLTLKPLKLAGLMRTDRSRNADRGLVLRTSGDHVRRLLGNRRTISPYKPDLEVLTWPQFDP